MNISYKLTSALLLAVLLFVSFACIFSGVNPLSPDIKNTRDAGPFSFTGIAAQMTGDSLANTVRLRFIDGRIGESLANWLLFDIWLQSQITMDTFNLFSSNYHIFFLMILLFQLIMVLWKHAKDGNKRCLLCK